MRIIDSIKKNIGDTTAINEKMAEIKRSFFMWNITSVIFYTAFSLIVVFTQWGNSVYLWVVTGITLFYILVSGLIILLSRKDAKKVKGRVRNYRSGMRILRSLLKIVAFSLNITAFVSVFGEENVMAAQILAYLSLVVAVFKILREVAVIINRRRKKFKGYNGVKAVIFDLDGTLADTLGDLASAVNHALASEGLPLRAVSEVQSFIGNGVAKLIERAIAPNTESFDRVYAHFKAYYNKHLLDATCAYDGVYDLLEWLRYKGVKTAVVSNKYDAATKKIVKKLFRRRIIETIGTTETVRPKPSKDGMLKALKTLKVRPDQAIYIGDSQVDLDTAAACGVPFIGAEWGFGTINSECVSLDAPDKIIAFLENKRKRRFYLPF